MDLPADSPMSLGALGALVRNTLKPAVRELGAAKIGERYGLAPSTVARLAADAPVYDVTILKAAMALGLITATPTPLAISLAPLPSDNG